MENRIINYNFSPLLQGLSKINTITILKNEIIKQHIQNWLAIFHIGSCTMENNLLLNQYGTCQPDRCVQVIKKKYNG
ncbi:MAG: hypothetical protein ACOC5R_03775 [Elusimicrobiota bacterium]